MIQVSMSSNKVILVQNFILLSKVILLHKKNKMVINYLKLYINTKLVIILVNYLLSMILPDKPVSKP
jgi:hypothetical protein